MIGQIGAADSFQVDVAVTSGGSPLNLTGATLTARAQETSGLTVTPSTSVPVAGTVRISTAAGVLGEGVWRITLTVALPGGATQTVYDDFLTVVSAPRVEWLSLPEAKAHLFVDFDEDDAFIQQCIDTAAKHIENITDYVVDSGSRTVTFAQFAPTMRLMKAPVRSVTAVRYFDADDVLQTVDTAVYRVGYPYAAPSIIRREGQSWPTTANYPDAVQIEVLCGPATPADVPMPVKHAGKLLVGHFYKHREAVTLGAMSTPLDMGVAALVAPYRQGWVA